MSALLSGRLPMILANKISDAIYAATVDGMELDEAACIAAAVAADYARSHYGNGYLAKLAEIVRQRADTPLPDETPKA